MSVQIRIPTRFARKLAKGQELFDVKGDSVAACIKELIMIVPKIQESLFYRESEILRSTIQVIVNNVRLDENSLLQEVKDGDRIQIKHHIH